MPRRTFLLVLILLSLAEAAVVFAQVGYRQERRLPQVGVPAQRTGFTFCRLVYTRTYNEPSGSGWDTDYPTADQNFMIRFSEFTKVNITKHEDGSPAHGLVWATDDALFRCPFLYGVDAGTIGWNDREVERMRQYLLKGGLLWVDDYWGELAWSRWLEQIKRVLPEYEVVDIPPEHPVYSSFYFIQNFPQIPSIQWWRRSGGETSERGLETAVPHFRGIFDEHGRLLVIMSHNTDIADGWEREGEDLAYFHAFSPYGYAVGINIAILSMTH